MLGILYAQSSAPIGQRSPLCEPACDKADCLTVDPWPLGLGLGLGLVSCLVGLIVPLGKKFGSLRAQWAT